MYLFNKNSYFFFCCNFFTSLKKTYFNFCESLKYASMTIDLHEIISHCGLKDSQTKVFSIKSNVKNSHIISILLQYFEMSNSWPRWNPGFHFVPFLYSKVTLFCHTLINNFILYFVIGYDYDYMNMKYSLCMCFYDISYNYILMSHWLP